MSIQRATRVVTHDYLAIRKDGIEYILDEGWELTDAGSYETRLKIEENTFSHGGYAVGDGKIDGRTIQLDFSMKGTTEQEHDEILNRACTYFAQADYDLCAGRSDRIFHVAGLSKFKHKYQKGFKQRWSHITVSLLLADPFRYEAQESKVVCTFNQAVSQAEIILHNLGSLDTPLTFRFIPTSSMASITMWHQENEEQFKISDTLLISPSETIVNGKEGTVWRGNSNSINTFSGQFLRAVPGSNTFLYTGGAGKIEITYYNRWFI